MISYILRITLNFDFGKFYFEEVTRGWWLIVGIVQSWNIGTGNAMKSASLTELRGCGATNFGDNLWVQEVLFCFGFFVCFRQRFADRIPFGSYVPSTTLKKRKDVKQRKPMCIGARL